MAAQRRGSVKTGLISLSNTFDSSYSVGIIESCHLSILPSAYCNYEHFINERDLCGSSQIVLPLGSACRNKHNLFLKKK